MIEMIVDSVRVSMGNQQRVVILKEAHADRYLFIWIEQPQAAAIAQELKGVTLQRPVTHDLLKSVIETMGGQVIQVAITDLRQAIYYARITIEIDGRQLEIDARPSDAIALAVRVKCPIFASEAVMREAAVIPEDTSKSQTKTSGKISSELPDVFRNFIENLDALDELGKSDD
jgi:bifunctional DNase/RNase